MKSTQYPTIRSEVSEMNRQIKQINLDQKIKIESETVAAHDAFVSKTPNFDVHEMTRIAELRLKSDRQNAQSARASAERDVARISRDVDRLTALLAADERASTAMVQISAATDKVAAAQTVVDNALTTKLEIDSMVDDENHSLRSALEKAGAAILEQVKTGKSSKSHPANRDKLNALLSAQSTADVELAEATGALSQCESDLELASDEHSCALADITARAVHLVSTDYVQVLAAHKAATARCGLDFYPPDIDQMFRLSVSTESV